MRDNPCSKQQDLQKLRGEWAEANKKAVVQEKRASNARGRANERLKTIKTMLQSQLDECVEAFNSSKSADLLLKRVELSSNWKDPNREHVEIVIQFVAKRDGSPVDHLLAGRGWSHPVIEAFTAHLKANLPWRGFYEPFVLFSGGYYDSEK